MSGRSMGADDELQAALAAAVARHDPVPPAVVAAAKGAFTWATIDAELAALTFDSLDDAGTLAGVRSVSAGPRALTFEHGDVVVDLEMGEPDDGPALVGQVTPPPVEVEVQWAAGGASAVPVDELGRFQVADRGTGPLRLRCGFGRARPPLVTEWITP